MNVLRQPPQLTECTTAAKTLGSGRGYSDESLSLIEIRYGYTVSISIIKWPTDRVIVFDMTN